MSLIQRALVGLLIALLAAIGAVLATGRPSGRASAPVFAGPTLPPNLRAANFALTDQAGHRVTLRRYRGKVVVITFIHSLCHDTCPFMVEQIKGALDDLPRSGRDVPVLGISVDPAEDTARNRAAFLDKHEMTGRMAFLNGPLPVMRQLWRRYAMQPVGGAIDHSTFVLLIDRRGFERIGYPADELTPEHLAHDIRVLAGESA